MDSSSITHGYGMVDRNAINDLPPGEQLKSWWKSKLLGAKMARGRKFTPVLTIEDNMSEQLPPERHEEAERIYQILKARIDMDLRQLAELLASKQDHQIFGATEFEVRDRVHRIGAEAI